jgi:hypothetical protein
MVLGIARSKIYGTPILHFFWDYNSLPVFRIVYPVSFRPPQLLLREDKLSLDKAIQICRAYEQSNKHVKELRENSSTSHAINKVTHFGPCTHCKFYPMLDIFLSYFHVYSHKIYIPYVKYLMLLTQVYLEIFLVVVCSLAPFDNFLTELRTRASSCNFDNKDRMIRDKIVFTVQGKLQELLPLT